MGGLGVIALLEIIAGIGVILAAKAVFGEMEGLMLFALGYLTLAVCVAGKSIVDAIDKLRTDIRESQAQPQKPAPIVIEASPAPNVTIPRPPASGYVHPPSSEPASPASPRSPGRPGRR